MYGHRMDGDGAPLPPQREGTAVCSQNVSKRELALPLQDRAGGLRLIRLAGKISSAQA